MSTETKLFFEMNIFSLHAFLTAIARAAMFCAAQDAEVISPSLLSQDFVEVISLFPLGIEGFKPTTTNEGGGDQDKIPPVQEMFKAAAVLPQSGNIYKPSINSFKQAIESVTDSVAPSLEAHALLTALFQQVQDVRPETIEAALIELAEIKEKKRKDSNDDSESSNDDLKSEESKARLFIPGDFILRQLRLGRMEGYGIEDEK